MDRKKQIEIASRSKYHKAWLEQELNMPMNFGQYIGDKKGENPGAIATFDYLDKTHKRLLKDVNSKYPKNRKTNIKGLEKYLTEVFFPNVDNNDPKYITRRLIAAIVETYNDIYNDTIETAGFTFERIISQQKNQNNPEGIKSTYRGQRQGFNAAFRTLSRELTDLKAVANAYANTGSTGFIDKANNEAALLSEHLKKSYNAYDFVLELLERNGIKDLKSLKSNMLISKKVLQNYKDLFTDKTTENEMRTIIQESIQKLDEFHNTMMTLDIVSKKTFGDIFEFALALLNKEVNLEDTIENTVMMDVAKAAKEKFVTGDKKVERGGGILNVSLDTTLPNINSFFLKDEKGNNILTKSGKEIEMTGFTAEKEIGPVTFRVDKMDSQINTGTKEYAKLDVTLTLPEEAKAGNKPFKISAKNWQNMSVNDLGDTSILTGLHRTLSVIDSTDKNEALLDYVYTMQHPTSSEPSGRSEEGKKALQKAHGVARESLVLDIAMGHSQGAFSADTLVIMDREKRKVHVIDMADEIRQYMANSEALNPNSIFKLQNYIPENIESGARVIRINVREGSNYVSRDRNYVSAMYLYLNGIKASVKLDLKRMKK